MYVFTMSVLSVLEAPGTNNNSLCVNTDGNKALSGSNYTVIGMGISIGT